MTFRIRNPLFGLSVATLLASCGGGAGVATDSTPSAPQSQAELRAAQPGELASYFRERIVQRLAQGLPVTDAPGPLAAAAAANAPLQEPGVDEDDLLKTDGDAVFALHAAYPTREGTTAPRLAVSRIQADGSLGEARAVTLDAAFAPTGLYHAPAAARVTVVAQRSGYGDIRPATASLIAMPPQEIALDVFDVASGTPAQQHRIAIDGRLVATRMVGSVLYVASTWQPDLSIYDLPAGMPRAQAEARLAALASPQLLPTIRVDGAPSQPLVQEADCLLQPANASLGLQLTSVTAIDLASPALARRSRCFVGDASGLYMSPSAMYVASSRQVWIAALPSITVLPVPVTTDIHKFALQGLAIDYRGSGEVAGTLGWEPEKMPSRMSEHNGDLRVVSATGQTASGSPATLTVLREDAAQRRLAVVSTLPNSRRTAPLGRAGEQVYGVHFAGPLAYLVTFRRVDPLYVVDLSDPADPRPAGELTVPGYSDYLFPLPGGKLLGVGKDAGADGVAQGVKLAVFDVSNPAQPALLASRTLGERLSASALDFSRHGISLYAQGSQVRVALPVRTATTVDGRTRYEQGLARFTVDTASGTLTQRARVLAMTFGPESDFNVLLQYDLARNRAVQTASASYYLAGGRVIASREP